MEFRRLTESNLQHTIVLSENFPSMRFLKERDLKGAATMNKKLYKNSQNKMIAGVCSGIADYFNVDATVIRLLWVLFCLLGGSGILAYIIAAIIIPSQPDEM